MEKSAFTPEYGLFLRHLRQTRIRSGLTQEQLAARLQETQSWVSKCERGEHRLDIIELYMFCLAMEVPLAQFVSELATALDDGRAK